MAEATDCLKEARINEAIVVCFVGCLAVARMTERVLNSVSVTERNRSNMVQDGGTI